MKLVSSAENSSLDWKAQYKYIEDIDDGRGYTAGIIGFCSGTGDMLDLVELYTDRKPGNVLAEVPARPARGGRQRLARRPGPELHRGLEDGRQGHRRSSRPRTTSATASTSTRRCSRARPTASRTLGQFCYYDAIVMHGDGSDATSFGGIRKRALAKAKPPSQGGNETTYLNAFLDARVWAMKQEEAHSDTSRVDTAQRVFLRNGNLDLNTPLDWKVYGDSYHIG